MKIFFDTEFLEGPQKKFFGYTKPTIDLISIGMVAEDGRELYCISKDFNLKEAWNRYQMEDTIAHGWVKNYWIRENVLKPIFKELFERFWKEPDYLGCVDMKFDLFNLKYLINKYGKTNKQIAQEIVSFVMPSKEDCKIESFSEYQKIYSNPEFYAYYADYDWVVFCWLFGTMMNLPNGFPMYCKDLKQIYDEKNYKLANSLIKDYIPIDPMITMCIIIASDNISRVIDFRQHPNYPKQENEHNALDDARWNLKLYNFLTTYIK